MDNEIELREEFQPAGLSLSEEFCRGEVFKVLIVPDKHRPELETLLSSVSNT